ncbi:MAG TPA: glycosyltransferase family 39 protein [Stellaceae bacterium]|nr:glycosyltransferase family 39 protein [Stellaceae bacterium]
MKRPSTKPAALPAGPAPDPFMRIALVAIFMVTFVRLAWLAGNPIDLYPDEAQYWIWAQHPDWGYFSKPPMVAWMIWATTNLFGDGLLAVKAGAPVAYAVTSVIVFFLAKRLYDTRVAAWSAIAFVTLPAVSLSAMVISTDVPLLLFWALATYAFVRAREPEGERWWGLVGIAIGLGLLSKYAMGFWIGSALLYLAVFADERPHLRRFLPALALGLAIYSPNFIWNWMHGFASYRHTGDNADVHSFALHPLAFAEFAGSQAAVFGPIFLAALLLIVAGGRRALADRRSALLLCFAVPSLCVMLIVAALSRAQPNWSAPTYVTATVLVVAWLSQIGREVLVQVSVLLHVALVVGAASLAPLAQKIGITLPGRYDLLHRVHGWQRLGRGLDEVRIRQGLPQLLGDEREFMAAMIYYMEPHPFDMQMWNPGGGVRNGFEMTQSLPDRPGGDFLWLTQRRETGEVLSRFESHEQVAHITVPIGGGLTREAWVYGLHGFKGYRDKP